MIFDAKERFNLSENFIEQYRDKQPEWGPLGYVVYKRSYAREIDNRTEEFWETCKRVVEGVFTIQLNHCRQLRLPWNAHKAQHSAQEMYRRMFEFKWLPPGRGLFSMGTDALYKRGSASLFNCGLCSTKDINFSFTEPFCWMMDMSMCGVGIGFDTKGAGKVKFVSPIVSGEYIIEDSKEGWVEAVRRVLSAYTSKEPLPVFNYSLIRPSGSPLVTSGGIAPGPQPLIDCIETLIKFFDSRIGQYITSVDIVDLMNIVGKCVVAGGKRRTAQIAFGEHNDGSYIKMKDPSNPELLSWRWASNNSIYGFEGLDYTQFVNQIATNGEPGIIYLDKMQHYGRLKDGYGDVDTNVIGTNPSLLAGTKVLTNEGIFNIENLYEFSLINKEGQPVKAKRTYTGYKQLYKITLQGGHEYFCTKEHKWPVKGIRTPTDKLKVGDTLPLIEKEALYYNPNGTREDGFFIGWLLGDGWITIRGDNGKKQIGLITSDKEKYIQEILENHLRKIGSQAKFNNNELNTQNSNIVEYLDKFGVKHKSSGLPSCVWSESSEKFRKGLIDGLFSSDGCVSGRVSFVTAHESLAKDVSELLGFYGIKTSIRLRTSRNVKFPNGKDYDKTYTSYQVTVYPCSNKHFKKLFKLTHLEKQEKLTNLKDGKKKPEVEIKKIEKAGRGDVHDISVFDNINCFDLAHCLTGNCGEISLESWELCNICETFPANHDDCEDYLKTLKYAYLYGKTVTLIPSHSEKTNQVQLKNRRIGVSMSGIVQAVEKFGTNSFFNNFCDKGYSELNKFDKIYSDWLCIPRSIKLTTVKPSGTVSLLPGATPGVHYAHSEYYFRTVRFAINSPLISALKKAGYRMEESVYGDNTIVVYFPVHEKNFRFSKEDVSIWQQLELGSKMQYYWADNSVSQTVTFSKEEAKQLKTALEFYEDQLKTVSFLPLTDHNYAQAPYQEITKEEYEQAVKSIKPIKFKNSTHEEQEKFCDGESCTL